MALIKHIKNTKAVIDNIPISEGQLLFVTDEPKIFLDISNTERIDFSNNSSNQINTDDKTLSNQLYGNHNGNITTSQYTGVNIYKRRINNHFEELTGRYDIFGNPIIRNTYYCSSMYSQLGLVNVPNGWFGVWAGLPDGNNLIIHNIKALLLEITENGIITSIGRGSYDTQALEVQIVNNYIYYRVQHSEFGQLASFNNFIDFSFTFSVVITVEFSFDSKTTVLENVYPILGYINNNYDNQPFKFLVNYKDYYGNDYYVIDRDIMIYYDINLFEGGYYDILNADEYLTTFECSLNLIGQNNIRLSDYMYIDSSDYGTLLENSFSFSHIGVNQITDNDIVSFLTQYHTTSGINKSLDINFKYEYENFNCANKIRNCLALNQIGYAEYPACADDIFGTNIDQNNNLINAQTKHTWFRLHDFVTPSH
jgi:hypothetical protein